METGSAATRVSRQDGATRRVRLKDHEHILAAMVLGGLGLFVLGPFLLGAIFNRFPSKTMVERLAVEKLPQSLKVGDWRKVSAISVAYPSVDVSEGVRRVKAESTITVARAQELFLPDDFEMRARSKRDDATAFAEALGVARKLSIAPPAFPKIALFKREEKDDEIFTHQINFERSDRLLPGPSFKEVIQAWKDVASAYAWRHDVAPKAGIQHIGQQPQILTRRQLPPDALVFGEPAAERAIAEFVEKRQRFIKKVFDTAEERNLGRFRSNVRSEVTRVVTEKFSASPSFTLSEVEVNALESTPEQAFELEATVEMLVNEDAFMALDFERESARFEGYDHGAFERAEAAMAEFFPEVDIGGIPRIVKRVAQKGDRLKYALTVKVRREGPLWETASVMWKDDHISKDAARGLLFPIGALGEKNRIVDSGSADADQQIKSQIQERKVFVGQVNRELEQMEERWGPAREAWKVMRRAIHVHGGQAMLDSFRGCKKEWRTTSSQDTLAESSELTEWFVYPNLFKANGVTNGRRREYFFSDGNAWAQTTSNQMQPLNKEDLINVNAQIFANHALLYLGRKDGEKVTLRYRGKTSPSTRSIEVVTDRCPGLELSFEESSGLLVRATYTVPVRGTPTARVIDYYFTPGQVFPKRAEESVGRAKHVSVLSNLTPIDPGILRGYASATPKPKPAPSGELWRLRDSTGKVHTPRDYVGRRLLVYYCGSDILDDRSYMNSPARNAAKLVGRVPLKYKSLGVSVLWIEDSMKYDAQRVGRVVAALGLNVPVVIKDENYLWPYKISGQPWAALFDAGGRMLRTFSGANEIQEIDSVLRSLR